MAKKKTKPKGLGRPSRLRAPPSKVGRPEFKVTREILAKAERWGVLQLTHVHIAALLGISTETEIQVRKRCPAFNEAVERGRAQGIANAAEAILDSVKLSPENARFVLDRKGGWRETLALRHTGPRGEPLTPPNIVVSWDPPAARERLGALLSAAKRRLDASEATE